MKYAQLNIRSDPSSRSSIQDWTFRRLLQRRGTLDSLGLITLLIDVEREFGVTVLTSEMGSLNPANIMDLSHAIANASFKDQVHQWMEFDLNISHLASPIAILIGLRARFPHVTCRLGDSTQSRLYIGIRETNCDIGSQIRKYLKISGVLKDDRS